MTSRGALAACQHTGAGSGMILALVRPDNRRLTQPRVVAVRAEVEEGHAREDLTPRAIPSPCNFTLPP